jgi:competence protein ComEC
MNKKAALFLAALLTICFIPTAYSKTGAAVTVHFINVGQGDSIFIDTSDRDVLIDGGSATATQTILECLADLNITQIHLVIATHAHEDHIGGLVDILDSTLTIDTVLYNNQTSHPQHTTNSSQTRKPTT